MTEVEPTTLVVIGNDYIGSCKSNYHMIMATTAPYSRVEITGAFNGVCADKSLNCVLSCRSLFAFFVIFLLTSVLSVLRYKASDFGR